MAEEFEVLKGLEPSQHLDVKVGKKRQSYALVTDIAYKNSQLNILELIETTAGSKGLVEHTFAFATDLPVNKKNVARLMEHCRARWRIENEGFNCQKNQGYYLTHLFSRNPIGIKNHYLLIQIAHILAQLILYGLPKLKKANDSIETFRAKILQAFQYKPLPMNFMQALEKVIYITAYSP